MRRSVTISENGRCGEITYTEGADSYAFYWEFGAGPTLVFIGVPSPETWDQQLPWAAGRRIEVLEQLAREVCRQKCARCGFRIEDAWLSILEP